MPTLTEKIDSREWTTGERPSVTLHYSLAGVADDLTVKALLTSSTASSYDGLDRESIQFEPVWVDTAANDGLWDCRVRYVSPEQKEPQVGSTQAGAPNTSPKASRRSRSTPRRARPPRTSRAPSA